jgi:uncharacterized protein (TIGR02147 family)
METESHADVVRYLKEIFAERAQAKKKYSLRAFSADLGISAAGLSQIFSRKKRLSVRRALEFVDRLRLDEKSAERFMLLVQIESPFSEDVRMKLLEKWSTLEGNDEDCQSVELDRFRLICDWYGFAILEAVTETKGPHTSGSLARKFRISPAEADLTLERLLRLNLITKVGQGKYKRTKTRFLVHPASAHSATKRYYESVLEELTGALATQSADEKAIGTEVFAFDPDQLETVKALTHDYLNRLNALAAKGEKRTEIYQAISAVFRLGKQQSKTEFQKESL